MKQLSQQAFLKAKSYIKSHARELDQALFAYYFEDGSALDVHDALAHYQNPDGGFGRALEPDIRSEASSPYVTTVAFQCLTSIQTESASELVIGGIAYFLNTFDFNLKGWMQVYEMVNDAPRAPWWDYDDEKARQTTAQNFANPGAEIVGYLYRYAELVPPDFLYERTRQAETWIETQPDKMEIHDLQCYIRLVNFLPAPDKVVAKLKSVLPKTVAMKPEDWHGYGLRPTGVVNSPDSPLADVLGSSLEESMTFDIDQQGDDGGWHPPWGWGRDEDVWKVAELEWTGLLTVNMLKKLHNFGRIEGLAEAG